MRFFRRYRIGKQWAIGCDLRNGSLIQFTRTTPYTGRHFILNALVFSCRTSMKDISKRETRTHISFGWRQGWWMRDLLHPIARCAGLIEDTAVELDHRRAVRNAEVERTWTADLRGKVTKP